MPAAFHDPIGELLQACCVKIAHDGARGGGCFVSPVILLTCAHLIPESKKPGDNITYITDNGSGPFEARILAISREEDEDYCILQSLLYKTSHFLLLNDGVSRDDRLQGYGYPVYHNEVRADGFWATYEARTKAPDPKRFPHGFHKFKDTNIQGGASGGPMVNVRTGFCIGVITESRNPKSERGAWLIPSSLLLEKLALLEDFPPDMSIQQQYWAKAIRDAQNNRKAGEIRDTLGSFVAFDGSTIEDKVVGLWSFKDPAEKLRDPVQFLWRGNKPPAFCAGGFKITDNARIGFIDTQASICIPCAYEEADCMAENFAAVKKGGLWGLVSAAHLPMIPFEFTDLFSPKDGLVKFQRQHGYGFMDLQGRELVPPRFKQLRIVSRNAIVATDFDDRLGLIDYHGAVRLPFDFRRISYLGEGFFSLADSGNRLGIYNSLTGYHAMADKPIGQLLPSFLLSFEPIAEITQVFPINAHILVGRTNCSAYGKTLFFLGYPQHSKLVDSFNLREAGLEAEDLLAISEGRLLVVYNDRKGFYTGRQCSIPLIYEDALPFSQGLAAVKQNGEWGFIDAHNQLQIPLRYQEVRPFCDGLAAVKEQDKWGFINGKGQLIIEHLFHDAANFKEQRCFARYKLTFGSYWVMLDTQGRILCKPE